jgi:hypothetical protein
LLLRVPKCTAIICDYKKITLRFLTQRREKRLETLTKTSLAH